MIPSSPLNLRIVLPAAVLVATAFGAGRPFSFAQDPGSAQGGTVADTVQRAIGAGGNDGGTPDQGQGSERPADSGPDDGGALDDSTPRGAMHLFLEACRRSEYEKASRYLDLEATNIVRESEGAATLAWRLKIVLDRTMWIDLEELSNAPGGDREDGMPERDRVGSIDTDRGPVHVTLARSSVGEGEPVWRISSSTLARVPYLYERFGHGDLGEYLPEFFFTITLASVQLWQWVGLLLLLLLVYLLSWIAVHLVARMIRPVVRRTRTEIDDRVLVALGPPARVFLAIILFSVASLILRLSVPARNVLGQIERAGAVIVAVWMVMRLADVTSALIKGRLERLDHRAALAVLPMGRRTFKVLIMALGGIAMMQTLGFNVTGLIASLGLGGLAVALAAQRSLENMFAGISLIGDQPVRVGDFCRFGDNHGWVEDIGLRSTRIRTLDRSLLAVPNSKFADLQLDNLAARDSIRFYTVLGLRYETTADQLRHVIIELRKMLVAHPKVSLEPFWRVRFVEFGAYSLNVEIFVYTRTNDYGEFTAIREDLLLRTIDIVEASGTAIAFPSQTTYLGRDGGMDEKRGEQAAGAVRAMREAKELPFPDFPPDTLEEVSDSLSYPPRGAVAAKRSERP